MTCNAIIEHGKFSNSMVCLLSVFMAEGHANLLLETGGKGEAFFLC